MDDVTIDSNVENLELYSDTYPFRLSLRISNFENESAYKKFVRNCEMMIRRCAEYKLWRNYIIDVLQVNECAITHETMEDVTIEVHHHVPSLFALVCSLVNECIDKNKEFCTFDICQKAIELHFKNKVGYVPLLKSMHEKFHNGKLTIPMSFIKGDYNHFVSEYSKYLDEDELDKIQLRLATNESNCTWSRDEYPAEAVGGR
jgi:hypothetical protein